MKKIDRSTYSKWRETTPPADPEAGINAMRALYKRVSDPKYAKEVRDQQRRHDAEMRRIVSAALKKAGLK